MEKLVALLKAKHIGARECRLRMSEILTKGESRIITVNGEPMKVLVSYNEMVDLLAEFAKQQRKLEHA